MLRNGNIVVLTNFADSSLTVLQRGCRLASRFGAKVHLLHLLEEDGDFDRSLFPSQLLAELKRFKQLTAQELLHVLAKSMDIPVTTHLIDNSDHPEKTIHDFTLEHSAGVVVLGRKHQRGSLEHALLDSCRGHPVPYSVLVTTSSN